MDNLRFKSDHRMSHPSCSNCTFLQCWGILGVHILVVNVKTYMFATFYNAILIVLPRFKPVEQISPPYSANWA